MAPRGLQHEIQGVFQTKFTTISSLSTKDENESASNREGDSDDVVQVGTKEYYKGFISRSVDEEPIERVTGDAVLGPTMKFVGGFTVILAALLLGFLASNGII